MMMQHLKIIPKVKNSIISNALKIVFILIVLQPILDILSYWLGFINLDSVVPILRLVLFSLVLVLAFLASSKKYIYFVVVGAALLYWIIHCGALVLRGSGIETIFNDTDMYVRLVWMPLLAISVASLLRNNTPKDNIATIAKALFINLVLVGLVVLLTHLTNTINYTYETTYLGTVGWFSNDNAQGIILVALVVGGLLYAYIKKSTLLYSFATLLGFSLLFAHGSRVTYFSIFAITITWLVALAISRTRAIAYYAPIIIAAVCAATLYSHSPMYLNKTELEASNIRATQTASHQITQQTQSPPNKQSESNSANNSPYEKYAPALVGRFGLDRVSQAFDNTSDLNIIRDYRKQKNIYVLLTLQESNVVTILFGHAYEDFTYNGTDLEPESDIATIIFLYGIVGAALYWILLAGTIIYISSKLLREKIQLVAPILFMLIAMLLCVAGLVGGHVALRTNVSIYIAVSLALLWNIATNQKSRSIIKRT